MVKNFQENNNQVPGS